MAKKKLDILKKVQKDYPDFTPTVDGLDVKSLEEKLATYAKHAESINRAEEADEKLEKMRAEAREKAKDYSEPRTAVKLKMRYITMLISDKGGKV